MFMPMTVAFSPGRLDVTKRITYDRYFELTQLLDQLDSRIVSQVDSIEHVLRNLDSSTAANAINDE